VECALQWTNAPAESIYTFVNNIGTHDGGTHVKGFNDALTRVVSNQARKMNLLKVNDADFNGECVRRGLTAIVSVKIPEPHFEGLNKERLGNPEIENITDRIVADKLTQVFQGDRAIADTISINVAGAAPI
jgi:DNA gyrase subunit B